MKTAHIADGIALTLQHAHMRGAAYLVYLGIRALRTPAGDAMLGSFDTASHAYIFRDGFLMALLNPKTAIFFAAFLPQFMDPAGSAIVQSISLGVVFVLIATVTDCSYVLAASSIAPLLGRMRGSGSAGQYVTASTFIGLGIFTAVSGGRGKQ